MVRGISRGVLGFAYFLPATALAAALILLGYAVDRLLPASLSRGYRRWMVLTVEGLGRPTDWLADRPADRVTLPVAEDSPR